VFSEQEFQKLPQHHLWDHVVDLVPGEHIIHNKPYSLTVDERKALDDWLDENLTSG